MSTTPAPACDGTRVTAYVDGVLPAEARAEVEAHLATCPPCREQEAFERGLRERMRALPAPELPPALEARVRREIRRRPVPAAVRWLPLAAGLALAVLWGRGAAPLRRLGARARPCPLLRAGEAARARSGPPTAARSRSGTGSEARTCRCSPPPREESSWWAAASARSSTGKSPTFTTRAKKRHLSVFVVPGPARFASGFVTRKAGENVRLLHTAGVTLALVSEDAETVDAFSRALSMTPGRRLRALPDSGCPVKAVRWEDVPVEPVTDVISRQVVTGRNEMIARVLLKRGAIVPTHSHVSEQVTWILEGALRLWIGVPEEEVTLRAGQMVVIPPDVPHRAEALEDTVDIDVFSPIRQDWLDGTDTYFHRK